MRLGGKKSYIILKADFEKAYDSVNREFLLYATKSGIL